MKKFIKLFFISLIVTAIYSIPSFAEPYYEPTPNAPALLQDMTPIKWTDDGIEKTTHADLGWYYYEENEWANVEDDNGNYWVWIPRFTYKIPEGEDKVLIKWSVGIDDDTTDGYMVHPAFTLDKYNGGNPNEADSYKDRSDNIELTGFWMAKYLASDNNGSIAIVPNEHSDNNKTIGKAFDVCLDIKSGLGVSSHLAKASEWGAVAYLTNAFGKEPDENDTSSTGGEDGALSTTNNMYGVFDMNGFEGEYLAAFVIKDALDSTVLGNVGNIMNETYERFVDVVNLTGDDNSTNNKSKLESFYGFAMTETENFSEDDSADVPTGGNPFFVKGGSNARLYGYSNSNGSGLGFRPTIAVYSSYLSEDMSFFDTEASIVSGDHLILSVTFSVDEKWKFDLEDDEKIIEAGNVVEANKKRLLDFIDLRYVQENETLEFSTSDLNGEVIGIIEGNRYIEEFSGANTFKADTQYTIRVRVGGRDSSGQPVFDVIKGASDMTSKIVVESISVKSVNNGADLKVTKIPNNKVRLSIFDSKGRVLSLSSAKLISAPEKTEYYCGEPLSLDGGKIEITYEGYEPIVKELKEVNVVDFDNVTKEVGDKRVELVYEGEKVTQRGSEDEITEENKDAVEFRIKVNPEQLFSVTGSDRPDETASIEGLGKYADGSTVTLTAKPKAGYKFSSWSSDDVNITNKNSSTTSFIMPANDVHVYITNKNSSTTSFIMPTNDAHVYINTEGAMELWDNDVKKEFEQGEAFGFGEGNIVAEYSDGTDEYLTFPAPGLSVYFKSESESEPDVEVKSKTKLDELGTKTVIVKYGGQELSYDIEIVKTKYDLIIDVDSLNGYINRDDKLIVPINDEKRTIIRVSYDTDIVLNGFEDNKIETVLNGLNVNLEAIANDEYIFNGWYISGAGVVDGINRENVSFVMPQSDVTVTALFAKACTVTYTVNDENYGYILGDTTQVIPYGGSTTKVEAVANDGYMFKKWDDGFGEAERLEQNVIKDVTYTAIFVKTWTVTYMVDDTVFAVRTIEHGKPGYISEIPRKYGYVFDKWDVNLTSVTQDIVTNAIFLPRISINPDGNSIPSDFVEGHITGRMIESGTLEYIISESETDTGEHISDYKNDDTFTFDPGGWKTYPDDPEWYKGYVQDSIEDSSTVMTITSPNYKELVKFEYKLCVEDYSDMLGITVNGQRITEYDLERNAVHSFNSEVNTIDGKIVIGISYSQDETYSDSDYAAIKNLKIGRQWTKITNEYDLEDSAIWTDNYVHIRGRGSDDGVMYQIVSNVFKGNSQNTGDLYSISYDLNGGTIEGENPKGYTVDTETFTLINPTKPDCTFMGWTGSNGTIPMTTVTIEKGTTGHKSYTANWKWDGYYIEVIQGANGTITPGSQSVTGGMVHFTISPDTAYKVSDVIVDGDSEGATNNYKFINVTQDHTITATFTPVYYSISYYLDGGVDPGNPESYCILSEDITLVAPTKAGYTFIGWTGSNGDTPSLDVVIPKGSMGDLAYTANWTTSQYTITVVQGENGTISPGTTTVNFGESITFSIKADENYLLNELIVDGNIVENNTTYTFNSITADHMISATFGISNSAPGVPTASVSSKTTSSFTVSAVATDVDGDNLVYKLYVKQTSGSTFSLKATSASTASGTAVSFTVSGLGEYTTHNYYVTATDGKETSTSSQGSVRTYCSGTGTCRETKYCSTYEYITCTSCNGNGYGGSAICSGETSKSGYITGGVSYCSDCGHSTDTLEIWLNCTNCRLSADIRECRTCGNEKSRSPDIQEDDHCSDCGGDGIAGTWCTTHNYEGGHYYCLIHENYRGSSSSHNACQHGYTSQH